MKRGDLRAAQEVMRRGRQILYVPSDEYADPREVVHFDDAPTTSIIGFNDAAALLAKLGKHTTGKGCLYIKKLADVDQHVLETLVVKSLTAKRARHPS